MDPDLDEYVERVGLFFESSGLPRAAGRILALLLVCEPPLRSAAGLSEELSLSKGSVSTMTRLLMSAGLVDRRTQPGDRTTYFRLADDGFEKLFAHKLKALTSFRALADDGLALLDNQPTERRQRLEHLRDLYGFFEQEMPRLFERWRATRLGAGERSRGKRSRS